jgi:predicted Zn-dependent protease
MLDVMKILETVTPQTGRQPEFMVTHPYPEHRMEDIDRWLKEHYPNGVPSTLTQGLPLRDGVPVGGRTPARGPARDTW